MKQLLWPMPVCFNKDISLQRPTAALPANGVSHFPGHGASIVIDSLMRFLHSASKVSCCLTAASRETKLPQCRRPVLHHRSTGENQAAGERQGVGKGKSVSVRVDIGGSSLLKKKKINREIN